MSSERAQMTWLTSSSAGTVTATRSRFRNDLITASSSGCATSRTGRSFPHEPSSSAASLVDGTAFDGPSTKTAAKLLADWGKETPLVVVATKDEENVAKSFRNLDRTVVTVPGALEVGAVVWARSLLVTQAALPLVEGRAT